MLMFLDTDIRHGRHGRHGGLRAMNKVLSMAMELQPKGLLLEAVEAPWKEESDGVDWHQRG